LLPFAEAFNVELATNAARDTPRDEGIAETNAMAKLSSLESDDRDVMGETLGRIHSKQDAVGGSCPSDRTQ